MQTSAPMDNGLVGSQTMTAAREGPFKEPERAVQTLATTLLNAPRPTGSFGHISQAKFSTTEARSSLHTWTTPIQIWEGKVLSVDRPSGLMRVNLVAKIGDTQDHKGEISLEWVAEQDLDLVKRGAIFYWTIFKEVRRGSIRNAQELRFRRFPSWSRTQLTRIRAEGQRLRARVQSLTRLEESKG